MSKTIPFTPSQFQVIDEVRKHVERRLENATATVADFIVDVSSGKPGAVSHALRWKGAGTMQAEALACLIEGLIGFLTAGADHPEVAKEDARFEAFLRILEEQRVRFGEDLVRDAGNVGNSTNPISNEEDYAALRAKSTFVRDVLTPSLQMLREARS